MEALQNKGGTWVPQAGPSQEHRTSVGGSSAATAAWGRQGTWTGVILEGVATGGTKANFGVAPPHKPSPSTAPASALYQLSSYPAEGVKGRNLVINQQASGIPMPGIQ